MHLLIIPHKKSSVHGQVSFKMKGDTLFYRRGPWICNFCPLAHLETPVGTQMFRYDAESLLDLSVSDYAEVN